MQGSVLLISQVASTQLLWTTKLMGAPTMASSRSAAGSGAKISPQMSPTSARCTAPVGWARAWGWLGVGCCTRLCVFMVFSFLFVLLAFTPEWEPLPHILLDGQVMRVGPPGISFGGPGWGGCPEGYRNGGELASDRRQK